MTSEKALLVKKKLEEEWLRDKAHSEILMWSMTLTLQL